MMELTVYHCQLQYTCSKVSRVKQDNKVLPFTVIKQYIKNPENYMHWDYMQYMSTAIFTRKSVACFTILLLVCIMLKHR